MIKYTRLFITFILAAIVFGAKAQSTATTSSPYSKYGIGLLDDQQLPQTQGMGGISTAINTIGGYNTINVLNPASYGKIGFTTIDAGLTTNFTTFSQNGTGNENNSNTRLSHIAFAIPVTKKSALSFGLLPYSELGYSYKTSVKGLGTSPTPTGSANVDTNLTNFIYSGEGGLSKAYLGYGFGIGRHLLVGANFSYIFGNLEENQSTEIPDLYGVLDSRQQEANHVRGINYDYGIQYTIDFPNYKHLVLGYSGSANTKLSVQNTFIVSQYTLDASGNENVAADTLVNHKSANAKIQLPQINRFGISYQKDGSVLIGADYTMGNWSALTIAGTNAGLVNSKTLNVGGQIIPNSNSLSNYLALINYQLGFIYDQTYLNINNTNIKRYAATFGLGLPLPHDRASSAFYKINFSAEVGRRGTLTNGLVQENYVNLHLGFTLNDKWFQRYKFE
jgi:hypothetical protein